MRHVLSLQYHSDKIEPGFDNNVVEALNAGLHSRFFSCILLNKNSDKATIQQAGSISRIKALFCIIIIQLTESVAFMRSSRQLK